MNWIEESKRVFKTERPLNFTNPLHCCECEEHNETLKSCDIESISINELGNPAWDPICFCSEEGKKYYFPAFVRLSLETINNEFYFGQLVFHLEYDGENSKFFKSCTSEQKKFVSSFVKYMIETFPEQIDSNFNSDDVLRAYEIWNQA